MPSEPPAPPAPGAPAAAMLPVGPRPPGGFGRRRTHPLTVALGFGGVGLGVAYSLALDGLNPLGLLIAMSSGFRLVHWWFHSYELRVDDMVVAAGVFRRREQVVPYQRVQQVDLHRGLLAQLLGLAEVRIDTAGSAAGHVALTYLDHAGAQTVRDWVLMRRAELTLSPTPIVADATTGSSPPPPPAPPAWPALVYALTPAQLVAAGATSTVPMVAIATAVLLSPLALGSLLAGDRPLAALGALAGAIAIVFGVVAFSALGQLLTFARYRLEVRGDELRVDYGLLEVQHLSVPRSRIQYVSILDNPLRRLFGAVSLTMHSAAPGNDNPSRCTVVWLPRERVPELLAFALGVPPRADSWLPELTPRPPAARRRAIVRRTGVLAVGALVATFAWYPAGAASLLAVAAGVPWGRRAHARAGHAVTSGVVVLSSGVVAHHVQIVPVGRLQSARTLASWFQRRVRVATLALDVAGASPRLMDVDEPIANELHATLPLVR